MASIKLPKLDLSAAERRLLGFTRAVDPDRLKAQVTEAVEAGKLAAKRGQQILDQFGAAAGNWRERLGLAERQAPSARPVSAVSFTPATRSRYECTIHSFEMKDAGGKRYQVLLDLIRADKNPQWGVGEDRYGLRAKVWDAETGELVAEKLVEKPREQFEREEGKLHILDGDGKMSFQSSGLDFDFQVRPEKGSAIQGGADLLRDQVQAVLGALGPKEREKVLDRFPFQLLVSDYPKARASGSLTLKTQSGDTLSLTATDTPSTFSHHYGNTVPPYTYLATVPQPGKSRFVAVLADLGVDLDPGKVGPELQVPFGYYIQTDPAGRSRYGLLQYSVEQQRENGFRIGSNLFGKSVEVTFSPDVKDGRVSLTNLPTTIGRGMGRLVTRAFGLEVGATEELPMVVDVGGPLIGQAGVDR